ncbi:Mannose-P-dolichol utilization defect 1 protein -like protein 2 [Capsicum annuum]|nr:Mannose-P-dolichol utilization defect 1 protein -like protein 2 [Capsicum annuum]
MVELKFLGMDFGCALGSLSNGQFPEKDCLLPLISKLLGYAIVGASTTVKLPQILKILQHKSVRGLSVVAFELELIGYTIALAYCLHKGLPFSAFGEYAFLLIQAPTVLAGQIDPVLFEALYASQHAIFLFARIPQIWKNFKIWDNRGLPANLNMDTRSPYPPRLEQMGINHIVLFASLAVNLNLRLHVALGSALGVLMNGTILGQIITYQKPTPKKEKKKD